ncbi:hypothetical protein PLEOSDRAFT_1056316 [Pleurotus ostreatus PC15]|uniref:General stress protein FMN-binding split barrel domain-containing protein n=1 Tax=Pleurotus ostreatus (strain PC15) TaxID=1137138 RepID=A0A067NUL0_PLEO1|nr:hypothetical protein PLEOSDRAFT_1056316 [Pleurotus ostreatus PC15]
MSTVSDKLDPYTAEAQNNDITPQQKILDLHTILKSVSSAMLTSRAADGQMHSRAMTPCTPQSDSQLTLVFIANNASHKFDELQNDVNVNVSVYNTSTTSWASFAGKAQITQDRDAVKKHWTSTVAAYFGDLKDGIHKGDENDPRVSIIKVTPEEIRYFLATKGTIGRNVGAMVGAVTGHVSVPGELRTISKNEIQLAEGLHTQ